MWHCKFETQESFMYRLSLLFLLSLFSLQTYSACDEVDGRNFPTITVGTTQQLIDALNSLDPTKQYNIRLVPGIYQFSDNQPLPAINSHVLINSDNSNGNTLEPVIFEGLGQGNRRGPVTLATIGDCGKLHLSEIVVRNFSGQYDSSLMLGIPPQFPVEDEKAPFIWNTGELILDRVQFIDQSETDPVKTQTDLLGVNLDSLTNNKKVTESFLSSTPIQSIGAPRYSITYINPLILNEGKLLLNSVVVSSFLSLSSHSIYNYGSATIENSYFEERSSIRGGRFPVFIKTFSGELSINFTSFVFVESSDPLAFGASTFLRTTDKNQIKVSNSIFHKRLASAFSINNLAPDNCDGEGVVSLGYNISDDDSCDLTEVGDLENTNPELREIANNNSELISVPYFGLTASSPAIDSASQIEQCGISRANLFIFPREAFDGNNDGEIHCDRGWPELTQTALSNGGVNGVFYDPQSDGHYLTVVDNDVNTLIIWNTFNLAGEPQWIYATGELKNGRSFVGDAYVNEGGRLDLDGTMQAAEAKLWGLLQVEFDSCNAANVSFQTNHDDFVNGAFKMQRLARVKQLGCVE